MLHNSRRARRFLFDHVVAACAPYGCTVAVHRNQTRDAHGGAQVARTRLWHRGPQFADGRARARKGH
eukprot:1514316-Prymnesium_polylepis.1